MRIIWCQFLFAMMCILYNCYIPLQHRNFAPFMSFVANYRNLMMLDGIIIVMLLSVLNPITKINDIYLICIVIWSWFVCNQMVKHYYPMIIMMDGIYLLRYWVLTVCYWLKRKISYSCLIWEWIDFVCNE